LIDMKKVIPLAILALILIPAYVVAAKSDTVSAAKPSIVLVHGAWADGSSWSRVIALLQDKGYTVYAPANPLRGLTSDSAYIADFLHTITGPIVLVGHSYGGAVITNAATGNPNVKALVFVDAFAPDQGESLGQLSSIPPPPGLSPSCLAGDPTQVFNFVPLTGGDVDTMSSKASSHRVSPTISRPAKERSSHPPNARFHSAFCQKSLELLHGRRSRPGISSEQLTRQSHHGRSSSWPSAPAPPSYRSEHLTSQ